MSKHNTEKDFYEIRALLTLQRVVGNEYNSLVRSESPDLVSAPKEFGVEITRTVDTESEAEHKFFNKEIKSHSVSEIDDKKLKSFQKSGKLISTLPIDGIQRVIGYSVAHWHSNDLVIETISRKIQLVNNGNYQSLKHLDLYVFSDSFNEYDECDIEDIMEKTVIAQAQYDIRFRYVFFDDVYSFFQIDLHNQKYRRFDITDISHEICSQAKKKAEES